MIFAFQVITLVEHLRLLHCQLLQLCQVNQILKVRFIFLLNFMTTLLPIMIAHCQFSGFSFTFIYFHFCRQFSTLLPIFFVKLQSSVLKKFHLTFFIFLILDNFFLNILFASYATRVLGRVSKDVIQSFIQRTLQIKL